MIGEVCSAIYRIINIKNQKLYIGSTCNFSQRIASHLSLLRLNKHHSRKLQNAWNKYGEESFKFEIIEQCSIDALLEREQYYFDNIKPHYNISFIAGRSNGIKRSAAFKRACSERNKGKATTEKQLSSLKRGWEKRRKELSVKVDQIDKANSAILKVWNSITEASNALGLYPQSIAFVCKNKQKTAGGFMWRYNKNSIQ